MQFEPDEFEQKVARADVTGSARYATLYITGKNVNVRWKEEDQTFTVTGSYGKTG